MFPIFPRFDFIEAVDSFKDISVQTFSTRKNLKKGEGTKRDEPWLLTVDEIHRTIKEFDKSIVIGN